MEKTDIMDEAKDERLRQEAIEYVAKVYREDRNLYNRASELVNKLALGGFWNGVSLAMQHTIMALVEEQVILRDKIDSIQEVEIRRD